MKTKTMYVADDGTPFDTEKECIAYEKSANEYIVFYKDKETNLFSQTFDNEPSAKHFIANCLHDCYEDNIVGDFKLVHRGKTVEFNSIELAYLVPARYNIDGKKLNEVFQMSATKNVKIEGYTLHGDYYLSDEVIIGKDWKEACETKEEVILPNGKKVIAHTLSKEEFESIPKEERKTDEWYSWYWTSTPYKDTGAWAVHHTGGFIGAYRSGWDGCGGARLGFKNPF